MPEPAMLDYFYGDEAEQYTFYRIPKVLFTDPAYRRISSDAKILYGLMLDRMGLSVRNGWLDDCQRVFIYFTLEDALEYLCCGHTKAVSLFAELDKGGLIERKKQGQGKPTKIYVKNFVQKGWIVIMTVNSHCMNLSSSFRSRKKLCNISRGLKFYTINTSMYVKILKTGSFFLQTDGMDCLSRMYFRFCYFC